MSVFEKMFHNLDRVFNHDRWAKDEEMMMKRKALNNTHDENMYGIQSNETINVEAAKNGKYLQNNYSNNSTNSKASDILN